MYILLTTHSWVQTDMGTMGARANGMEAAPVTLKDSINGILDKVILTRDLVRVCDKANDFLSRLTMRLEKRPLAPSSPLMERNVPGERPASE